MTVYALFNELREKGIKLWHEDGQLKFRAAKGSLTKDIRQKLITNKSDIVVFLQQLSAAKNIPPILSIDRSKFDRLPLIFAQERLWVIDQMNGDSTGYNIPGAVRIDGELNIKHVEETFNIIIARHESLRTTFPNKGGYPEQLIADNVDFTLEFIDYSHLKKQKTRDEKAKQYCETEATSSFDLEKGPLIRGAIIRLSLQEHILMMNMHHIISDGWSIGVLINEFSYIMDKLEQGETIDFPLMSIQYVDYSIWQRRWFEESGILTKQLNYWQDKLTGVASSLEMVCDYPRPSIQSFAGAKQKFIIDKDTCEDLKILTKHQGCTFYMTLLAAFKVLMYRYTGQEDICIGSPIANRQYSETEDLIGMFVNTLALRDQLVSDDSFVNVLDKVRTTCLQAYENQDIPFEKIVDLVQPQRNIAISPLFQIMVVLQNVPMEELEQHIEINSDTSQFDLTLEFTESAGELIGSIEYCTALYKEHTIEGMITHFKALCHAIIRTPEAKISELNYIAQPELDQLLTGFNNTHKDYPQNKCIHQLFAEQAKLTPDNTAIVFEGEKLTYLELYNKSQTIALYLQDLGVVPDTLVGLCIEKSVDMIVAMLGILQAGGAYVPMDPEYPDKRLAYIVQDSQTNIVLTQEKFRHRLNGFVVSDTKVIALDGQWSAIKHCVNSLIVKGVELQEDVTSEHLAYVIYTSGTTGKPKGVMLEHNSLHSLCLWHKKEFNVSATSRATQVASIAFDAATWEIWPYLLNSSSLFLVKKEDSLDLARFNRFILDNKITHSFLVTPMAQQLLESNNLKDSCLQYLLVGGDKLSAYKDKGYTFTVVNNYGPTETTVVATSLQIQGDFSVQTIGQPITNTQIYILDQRNKLQGIGVPGELHIAGDGLARGYLNQPELTSEKFIANPFNLGTRLYKSGDLARWLPDGTIEYLGRIDTQVKIRGFRIETGEIENKLNLLAEITESVVVAQGEASNKQLIAFYLVEGNENKLTDDDLRQYLQKSLPEYMLPAAFVCLETIPLTSNGKVDRRVLEQMEIQLESNQEYQAPANNTEKKLVDIWAEVLSLSPDSIGVNDNFFSLGGHSLFATVVIAKIRSTFKVELSIFSLFEQGCIKHLAKVITNTNKLNVSSIQTIDRKNLSVLPLSYAQERLWFINQLEPNTAVYNIPGAVSIRGELDFCLVQ